MTAAATRRKIEGFVRRRVGDHNIELTIMVSNVVVTEGRVAAADRLAAEMHVSPEEVLASRQVLKGPSVRWWKIYVGGGNSPASRIL